MAENYEGQENEMYNSRVSHECKNLIYDCKNNCMMMKKYLYKFF